MLTLDSSLLGHLDKSKLSQHEARLLEQCVALSDSLIRLNKHDTECLIACVHVEERRSESSLYFGMLSVFPRLQAYGASCPLPHLLQSMI